MAYLKQPLRPWESWALVKVDELAAAACWSDREWVLNMADLVVGCVAQSRWDCLWNNQSPLSEEFRT